jgi:hypothetical protein
MNTTMLRLLRPALAGALLLATNHAAADYWGYRPYGWYQPPPVYVAPPPPPPIYAAPAYPPPMYMAPPVTYAPPPPPPGLSIGIPPFYLNLPLGGGWGPPHHHHHRGHW